MTLQYTLRMKMILVLRWAIELRKIPVEPVIRMWVFPVILCECNCRQRLIILDSLYWRRVVSWSGAIKIIEITKESGDDDMAATERRLTGPESNPYISFIYSYIETRDSFLSFLFC